jgi:hypothetical protein
MITRSKARKRPSWMQRYQRAAEQLGAHLRAMLQEIESGVMLDSAEVK